MRKRTPIRGCKLVKRATLEGLHAAASTVKADYVCLHMATKLKKSQSRWGDKASGQVAGFGSVLVCGKCSRSNVFWQEGGPTVPVQHNKSANLTMGAKAGK